MTQQQKTTTELQVHDLGQEHTECGGVNIWRCQPFPITWDSGVMVQHMGTLLSICIILNLAKSRLSQKNVQNDLKK